MNLSTRFAGIELENPLMPASGPLVGDADKIRAIAEFGVGGMVTKTISTKPAEVPRPCIYGEKKMIMNAELWSEFSPERWIQEFLPNIKNSIKTPLFISAGYTKEDMEILIPQLEPFADAFEISTHYVGKDLDEIGKTVETIRSRTDKPVFMKMSPHIPNPVEFAQRVLDHGGTGIVAINSLGPTLKIDLSSKSVLLGNHQGEVWASGPVIKPLALGIVSRIKRAVPECVIIGVGGIESAVDVLEFLLAGADAVQMLSAAMLRGKNLYEKIIKDLPKILEKYGFASIEEVIQTKLQIKDIRYTPKIPVVNYEKCTVCKRCVKVCPYFAIQLKEQIEISTEACFGCGLCQTQCPTQAIQGAYE